MICVAPSTRSLGYVFMDYLTNGHIIPHRMRLRLVYPIDPSDLGTIGGEVILWANVIKAILPNTSSIVGWGTMRSDGTVLSVSAFPAPITGTHTAAVGARDVESLTITFTGRGLPVSSTECSGPTRSVAFVGIAFWPTAGQKYYANGTDAALDAVENFLTGNSVLGADFYGQIASWRSRYPVQYNAHAQRRLGT